MCAPTTGFCRQLEQQLANTLQVTVALCQDDSDSPAAAVAGGGAWEMAVIRQLEKCIQDQRITKYCLLHHTVYNTRLPLIFVVLFVVSLPATHLNGPQSKPSRRSVSIVELLAMCKANMSRCLMALPFTVHLSGTDGHPPLSPHRLPPSTHYAALHTSTLHQQHSDHIRISLHGSGLCEWSVNPCNLVY